MMFVAGVVANNWETGVDVRGKHNRECVPPTDLTCGSYLSVGCVVVIEVRNYLEESNWFYAPDDDK